jgi:thiosulfate dehydrogenase
MKGWLLLTAVACVLVLGVMWISGSNKKTSTSWQAPDSTQIPATPRGDSIRYGRELIRNTAYYLGPKGTVQTISNGMNCQNCHLDAGTKFYGNNFSAVAATYPKFRARSGTIETIEKRINDCIERSLNGQPLDLNSHEILAIKSYILWVGLNVAKDESPQGSGLMTVPFLDRAANPAKGKELYATKCVACHGAQGTGVLKPDSSGYVFPPLWGDNSFNVSAGLYRLTRMAGYIKANMPQTATSETQLTDEDTQPRPIKKFVDDWPDIKQKPIDHPFGPYDDEFTESQHKLGPFKPIQAQREPN